MARQHNFHRGGHLSVYDKQTSEALVHLAAVLPEKDLASYRRLWEEALDSRYEGRPVWVHGDVAVGNLLVQNGRLSAMIDFGTMGVGGASGSAHAVKSFIKKSIKNPGKSCMVSAFLGGFVFVLVEAVAANYHIRHVQRFGI